MIRSFGDPKTQKIFERKSGKGFPADLVRIAQRKLEMLHAATRLEDLSAVPGNRLEKLAGDRKGHMSIRLNDQFRVTFVWKEGGADHVSIEDYH